jgi:glucosamine-6-phosphate deaminase
VSAVQIHIFDTEHEVARALAARVAAAVNRSPGLVLGLPTGRTPIATYEEIGELHAAGRVSFAGVSTFNLDEFVGVDRKHPGSFRHFMERHLFEAIDLRPERIHFLNGLAPDLRDECARYEREIDASGGIDLQLLGIGANGHIGFNEPAEELEAATHVVRLLEETRRDNAALFAGDLGRVPHEALSMGMGTILKAAAIILVATGAKKAECIARTVEGRVTTRLPASFLQMHRRVELYLDAPAASLLAVKHRA